MKSGFTRYRPEEIRELPPTRRTGSLCGSRWLGARLPAGAMLVEPGEFADRSALLATIAVQGYEVLERRLRNELGWRPRPAETTISA
jgi:hypothetical protein